MPIIYINLWEFSWFSFLWGVDSYETSPMQTTQRPWWSPRLHGSVHNCERWALPWLTRLVSLVWNTKLGSGAPNVQFWRWNVVLFFSSGIFVVETSFLSVLRSSQHQLGVSDGKSLSGNHHFITWPPPATSARGRPCRATLSGVRPHRWRPDRTEDKRPKRETLRPCDATPWWKLDHFPEWYWNGSIDQNVTLLLCIVVLWGSLPKWLGKECICKKQFTFLSLLNEQQKRRNPTTVDENPFKIG